jgi:hypothetical protein
VKRRGRGIWRSNDAGATWTQIKPSPNASQITTREAIAVTALPNGKTRMYVYEGNNGTDTSRLFRSDDVATGAPVFTNMTSSSEANPGWGWHAICDREGAAGRSLASRPSTQTLLADRRISPSAFATITAPVGVNQKGGACDDSQPLLRS